MKTGVGGETQEQLASHPHYAQNPQTPGEQMAQTCANAWFQQLPDKISDTMAHANAENAE